MRRIDDTVSENLDNLALEHWERLKGKLKLGNGYHSTQSLIGRIESQLKKDSKNGEHQRELFWHFLIDNSAEHLKEIIISRPQRLSEIIEEINEEFGYDMFAVNSDYNTSRLTEFGEIIKRVFPYDNYRGNPEFISSLIKYGLKVCPYCNQNPIGIITRPSNQLALFELDHFYPRSRYPYLSLSFSNLIPVCGICNGPLKSDKDFKINTHFNPFHNSLDQHINFKLASPILESSDEIEILAEQDSYYLHIRDLEIAKRYEIISGDLIFDFVQNLRNHSERIRGSIFSQFVRLFKNRNESKHRLFKNLQVPLDPRDINKYPLSKVKRDICIQMGFDLT